MTYNITIEVQTSPAADDVKDELRLAKAVFTDLRHKLKAQDIKVEPGAKKIDDEHCIWNVDIAFPWESANVEEAFTDICYDFVVRWMNAHGNIPTIKIEDGEKVYTFAKVGRDYQLDLEFKIEEEKKKPLPEEVQYIKGTNVKKVHAKESK